MDHVNELNGHLVLTYYVNVITYFCELPDVFTVAYFHGAGYSLIFYVLYIAATWTMAAEFHDYVLKSFMQWYKTKRNDQTSRLNLMTVNYELYLNPIAISSKFFVVTNGFLTSVSSLN